MEYLLARLFGNCSLQLLTLLDWTLQGGSFKNLYSPLYWYGAIMVIPWVAMTLAPSYWKVRSRTGYVAKGFNLPYNAVLVHCTTISSAGSPRKLLASVLPTQLAWKTAA